MFQEAVHPKFGRLANKARKMGKVSNAADLRKIVVSLKGAEFQAEIFFIDRVLPLVLSIGRRNRFLCCGAVVVVVVEYDIRQRGMLFGNVLAANVNVSVGYRVRKPRSALMVPNNSCLIAAVPGKSIQCSTVPLSWLYRLQEGSIIGSISLL